MPKPYHDRVVEELRSRIAHLERAGRVRRDGLSTGVAALDARLPERGLARGALHEFVSGGPDLGHAAAPARFIASVLGRAKRPVLWVLRRRDLFAPGLATAGLHPDRVIYAETGSDDAVLPIAEEGQRSEGDVSVARAAQNCLEQRTSVVRPRRLAVCWPHTIPEAAMETILRVAKRLVPIEEVALVEPFVVDPASPPLRTARDLRSRIILLDKTSILFERTPEEVASARDFRFIEADRIAANPAVHFWVEVFVAAPNFVAARPFQSRLLWRDHRGQVQSRLLTVPAETALAIAVRGAPDPSRVAREVACPGIRGSTAGERSPSAVAP